MIEVYHGRSQWCIWVLIRHRLKKILDNNGHSVYYAPMLNATDKKEIQDIFAKEAGSIISQEIHVLLPKILSQNGVMTPSGKNQRSRTQKSTTDAGTDHTVDHAADQEAPYALGAIETLPKGSTDVKLQFMYQYMYLNFKLVNQRFEDMNKRFEDMHKTMNRHSEDMHKTMDRHSEDMNKRFEDMNKRFEDMNKRFNSLQWFIGIIVGLGTAVLAALIALLRFPIQ